MLVIIGNGGYDPIVAAKVHKVLKTRATTATPPVPLWTRTCCSCRTPSSLAELASNVLLSASHLPSVLR